jgi:hypothetical protein
MCKDVDVETPVFIVIFLVMFAWSIAVDVARKMKEIQS